MTVKVLKYKDQAEMFIEEFKNNKLLNFEICDSIQDLFNADIIVSCVSFAHKELAPVDTYPTGCTIIPVHTAGFQNCDLEFEKVIVDDIDHVKSIVIMTNLKAGWPE